MINLSPTMAIATFTVLMMSFFGEARGSATLFVSDAGGSSHFAVEQATATERVTIGSIEFEEKLPDFGGEACVSMFLKSLGMSVDQELIFDQAGVDPLLGRGCYTPELVTALKKMRIETGPVWHVHNPKTIDAIWKQMVEELRNKIPSLFVLRENGDEKFVLVSGLDTQTRTIVFQDPSLKTGADRSMGAARFFERCNISDQLIKIRLETRNMIAPRSSRGFGSADYAQHIRRLKSRLPSPDFHVMIEAPFVVIGNESLEKVKGHSKNTIKWAVDKIKADYFEKDPNKIIEIWLFKDRESYETNCNQLFKMDPGTPYGFYSSFHGALVMNISTGGGTLVHEIVHPFIESNFPGCPSWFNEGLASLYEQSGERNGKIVGRTNWRLRGLQIAIDSERLGSFRTLCETSRREFYDDPNGTNYAQARYLCYYLQERGKLRTYYHKFRAAAETDPSGYATLKQVLEVDDMTSFQRDWERYVMKLRF